MFSLEELQKMNKNELISIIGNYLSDQEIWLNKVKELEKQNDKKSAEIERLTKERDGYLDGRFAVCHALREMKKGNAELQKQVDELTIKNENAQKALHNYLQPRKEIEMQAIKDAAKEILDKCIAIDKATGGKGFVCIEAISELVKGKSMEVE